METQKEKKGRIRNLIYKVLESGGLGYEEIDSLSKYRSEAVDQILTELQTQKTEKKLPSLNDSFDWGGVSGLAAIVNKFAERRHSLQIAKMLMWDEIIHSINLGAAIHLLLALERNGDSSVVPILKKFAEKIKSRKQKYQLDQEKIMKIITSCQQRPAK